MLKTKLSDEFLTDQAIADLAKKVLGDIYFDPFGHKAQRVRVRTMHTAETGNQPWPDHGPIWCNPPFSASATQVPRVAEWVSKHKIDCLMLCLAAPGSNYWREAIWSKTGPQRIAWLPRISFDFFDDRPEIMEHRWIESDKIISPATVRRLEREGDPEKLARVKGRMVPNPNFKKVAATEHTISYDTALMLWSTDSVTVNRFVREVTAYGKEQNPKAGPIGISLGGGPQP